jgi:hypothetical protein
MRSLLPFASVGAATFLAGCLSVRLPVPGDVRVQAFDYHPALPALDRTDPSNEGISEEACSGSCGSTAAEPTAPARVGIAQSGVTGPFDAAVAHEAIAPVDVSSCEAKGAPVGYGHARVTFRPSGIVSRVAIDAPIGMSQEAVACLGDRLGRATVPNFQGGEITMGTGYRLK